MKAIQVIEHFKTADDAIQCFNVMEQQNGYIGGRVLYPCGQPGKDDYRVQLFFEHDGLTDGWLPDGCKRVLILDSQAKMLGIKV